MEKSRWDKILGIDRRILHGLLFIAVALPLIYPIGLSVPINEGTIKVYELIESFPENSIIIAKFDSSAGAFDEMCASQIAMGQHLFDRPLRLVFLATGNPDAPILVLDKVFPQIDMHGKEYGKDYVFLGFIMGGETALAALAVDVHELISVDYFGTPLEDLPLMDDVKNAEDITGVIMVGSGDQDEFIRQYTSPYGIPFAMGSMGVTTPRLMPYVQSGEIVGLVDGLRGGAEYEHLVGKPGAGLAGTDAISVSHMLILLFLMLGNIAFFMKSREKK